MFKIKSAATFKWPVKVQVPGDGKHFEHTFMGHFAESEKEEIDQLAADSEGETAFLKAKWLGWDEGQVQEESGQPLEPTDANRERLLKIVYVRTAVIDAYFEGTAGRKAKNSKR